MSCSVSQTVYAISVVGKFLTIFEICEHEVAGIKDFQFIKLLISIINNWLELHPIRKRLIEIVSHSQVLLIHHALVDRAV